jgi:hypothetical protein
MEFIFNLILNVPIKHAYNKILTIFHMNKDYLTNI